MQPRTALVLSGGGMFGAWQAGAWCALALSFRPDLVVGASVGALNGYGIACGWAPEELCAFWRREDSCGFSHLSKTIDELISAKPLRIDFATVVVDVLRMKPITIPGDRVTANHLLASCAVPLVVAPKRIDGHWYMDGGLLNPLPVWVAVELGATRIIALHALPEIPSRVLSPFVKIFRAVFGYHPALPQGVELTMILPSQHLGGMGDAIRWKRENIDRWIALGAKDTHAVLAR